MCAAIGNLQGVVHIQNTEYSVLGITVGVYCVPSPAVTGMPLGPFGAQAGLIARHSTSRLGKPCLFPYHNRGLKHVSPQQHDWHGKLMHAKWENKQLAKLQDTHNKLCRTCKSSLFSGRALVQLAAAAFKLAGQEKRVQASSGTL